MHFDRPQAFWFFVTLLPICIIFALTVHSFHRFNQGKNLKELFAYSHIPTWRRRIFVYAAYIVALSSCFLGLTNPYIYVEAKDKEYNNIRLIFLVDVSRSMVYAEDISPNRLDATKKELKKFYTSLDGLYECSILPFAGDVNPYFCPLTTSRISFLGMLDEMDWRSAPTLGTDLTKAIEAINEVYIKKDKIDQDGLNIVILFSDGGKEEAMATNRVKLLSLTQQLATKNFKFYTVGVGGDQATPLIVRDSKGGFVRYITDEHNHIATSLMDEEILKQISETGNGKYYHLNASKVLTYDLDNIIKDARKLVSEKSKQEKFYLQHYLFSVTVCLLFLCLLSNKV